MEDDPRRPIDELRLRRSGQGDDMGLTLPPDLLDRAGLQRGDSVTLTVDPATGTITLRKSDDTYRRAMAAGRAFAARYRHTLAALAK
jgi:antitoxin component of MazEF toxin-antitoxin module